jgi:predicted Fe-S protein YdhL (DUF1289 family)
VTGKDPEVVASPCVRNCCLGADDVCVGCGRSLDEILRWRDTGAPERRELLQVARDRLTRLEKQRG